MYRFVIRIGSPFLFLMIKSKYLIFQSVNKKSDGEINLEANLTLPTLLKANSIPSSSPPPGVLSQKRIKQTAKRSALCSVFNGFRGEFNCLGFHEHGISRNLEESWGISSYDSKKKKKKEYVYKVIL